MSRNEAILDAYTGLRRIGYTPIGALTALVTIGVPADAARAAAALYEQNERLLNAATASM